MTRPIRVLVAKPGLDGHDRGAKVIARALRDAGMEVIYTGLRQTPEMIVNAALQEDVQVIGLSILSGAHNAIVPRVMDLLREKDMTDVKVIVGGIVPDEDAAALKQRGVAAVFQPGASLEAIVEFIRRSVVKVGAGASAPPMSVGRMLIALGVLLVVLGLLLTIGEKLPLRLGHLPGDVYLRGKHTSFYFPVVTCLLLSVVLSLAMWLFRR